MTPTQPTKVLAVWLYDKRAVNGAPAVYFGTKLRPLGEVEQRIADYVVRGPTTQTTRNQQPAQSTPTDPD